VSDRDDFYVPMDTLVLLVILKLVSTSNHLYWYRHQKKHQQKFYWNWSNHSNQL